MLHISFSPHASLIRFQLKLAAGFVKDEMIGTECHGCGLVYIFVCRQSVGGLVGGGGFNPFNTR